MKRRLLASSILVLLLSGCSQSGSDTGNSAGNSAGNAGENVADAALIETTGSPATIGANGPSKISAETFVTQAALSDMYEIKAATIALTKTQSAAIKGFAQQMIEAHGATSAALKTLLPTSGVTAPLPTALDSRHATMIEDLQKAGPDKFDEEYLDQQTQAHRAALGLMESYAAHGENPALKTFAGETKPKIQMHLQTVSKLDHGAADEPKGAAGGNSAG